MSTPSKPAPGAFDPIYAKLSAYGYVVAPGDLGENITTSGLKLERLPQGTLLRLGTSTVIELTGLRTPCVLIDRFRAGLKNHVVQPANTSSRFP